MTTPHDTSPQHESRSRTGLKEAVMPIVQEVLHVEKHKVETGRVRLTKTVQEREVMVTEPSVQEYIQIERVPVNRWLSEPAPVRYEGDIMIIPVMEEVPVVGKRLRLKEELRVTKRQITTQRSEPVRLRTGVRVQRGACHVEGHQYGPMSGAAVPWRLTGDTTPRFLHGDGHIPLGRQTEAWRPVEIAGNSADLWRLGVQYMIVRDAGKSNRRLNTGTVRRQDSKPDRT